MTPLTPLRTASFALKIKEVKWIIVGESDAATI